MNPLQEYRRWLQDNGFSDSEADRIARTRLAAAPTRRQNGNMRVAAAGDKEGEILLYGSIGFDFWSGEGMTPKKLVDQIAALGPVDKITVRINSPGGDVFDGMTIYNILLRQEAQVVVEVEGLAASAASFIMQAADDGQLAMSEASTAMTHRAWGGTLGNTHDMLAMASLLEKLDGQIAGIYAGRSGRKADTWLNIMDDETWFTAQEAVDAKLADRVIVAQRVAASIDPTALASYRNVPTALAARLAAPIEKPAPAAHNDAAEAERVKVRLRLLELDAA